MTIVLDSNVLLVAIGKSSRYRLVWQSFVREQYRIVITNEILSEYEEILYEHGAPGAAEIVLSILAKAANIVHQRIFYKWNAITADPDDNKFFDAAVAAGVDYLVTNDTHFNEAKRIFFPKVNIVSADEFLTVLERTTK